LNLRDFYYQRIVPLHDLYRYIESEGIKVDPDARRALQDKYEKMNSENESELESLLGFSINVNSPVRVSHLLYETLKVPRRKDVGEETLIALKLNVVKDERRRKIIDLILKGRKVKKIISTYINAPVDLDGRIRTTYNYAVVETGRTSTSKIKPPVRAGSAGLAFQTLTKHGDVGADLRSMFVPDDGYVFIEPDLSQAETRVVALLAEDKEGLENFRKFDETGERKYDVHVVTASKLFNVGVDDIDNEQRQLGKHIRHGTERGMGKHRLSMFAGSMGCNISEWQAGKFLAKFHIEYPNLEGVYFSQIRDHLANNNLTLISPHGRRRQFYERWGDELFKEAYSQLPQCTVSDHLKFALLRIHTKAPWIHILQESHDSSLMMVPEVKIDESCKIIREELSVPIDFAECSLPRGKLVIPCEIKIGRKNWQYMEAL